MLNKLQSESWLFNSFVINLRLVTLLVKFSFSLCQLGVRSQSLNRSISSNMQCTSWLKQLVLDRLIRIGWSGNGLSKLIICGLLWNHSWRCTWRQFIFRNKLGAQHYNSRGINTFFKRNCHHTEFFKGLFVPSNLEWQHSYQFLSCIWLCVKF